ncbi:hypothetical protein K439DRAFT_1663846 [Ramaria rubella]|nr:hypothetical protein K439DRAFT_1663846 [Ramaria rubella]
MATIQDRAFSRDYSGLRNQLEVAAVLITACLVGYELMRRKRRGRGLGQYAEIKEGVGSVETWEFGYLYQGRCWAKNPSPALPKWPLAWVMQALQIPESTLPDLLGLDATLYIRFLKACRWFVVLQTCTTFPVLFSIHIVFSPSSISIQSMDKASISSLVQSSHGLGLLFVHVILAYWITITWILTLLWVARGIFRYRALDIQNTAEKFFPPIDEPNDHDHDDNQGLRLRTVMVTNVPAPLRNEKALKEYFEYYMSRPLGTAPISPGFIPKIMTFLFNRAAASSAVKHFKTVADESATDNTESKQLPAIVERVVVARKMTELASLLERRQEVLKKLEYAHVRLARKALQAARAHLDDPACDPESKGLLARITSRRSSDAANDSHKDEEGVPIPDTDPEAQLNLITETLAPFVSEFHVPSPKRIRRNLSRIRHYTKSSSASPTSTFSPSSPTARAPQYNTIWEALYSLPRACLDAYQPLINLNRLFLGQTVPAIDFHAAKLGLLTALIHENRGRTLEAYPPSSTVFVTFEKIEDARRAAKYLQAHPRNPLACLVVPAPDVADLDWMRVMKSSFTGEFLKDWVVDLGVWAFTCSWIIPISLLVGLVNIQNLSIFIPGLQRYLQKHPRDQEAISSLLPTILVSILTILIPMLLLLIAKKAHTIITFSKLHDTIMIRYWKFLVCNLLIFFCVGVAALESFLQSFRNSVNPIPLIASSFPSAGPFYVGWLILQTAIHGFLELGLYGLPLILYPSTKAATTLRRRAAGVRPRTFNFYYWLPNHILVVTIVMCFALLNPLVIPFAFVYFSFESVIVKHQLVHVYAKTYDNNGKLILIRIVRYSLDGLIVAQLVFLAFLVVLRQNSKAAVIGVLLGCTVIVKLGLTRLCRAKFAENDHAEDAVYSGRELEFVPPDVTHECERRAKDNTSRAATLGSLLPYGTSRFWTWKLRHGIEFAYASVPARPQRATRRAANPFGPTSSFTRITSLEKPEWPQQTMHRDITDMEGELQPNVPALASVDDNAPLGPPFQEEVHKSPVRHNTTATHRITNPSIVTPHAKLANWDDCPYLNKPYENPFYVAPVDNFLWLPRNPFGVLDLDDSVDMHQALTSEPGAAKIGQWMNETVEDRLSALGPLVETPTSIQSPDSHHHELVRESFPFPIDRPLSGTEEISLPSIISARVQHIDQEDEIDHASPHRSSFGRSSYSRRMSNTRGPSTAEAIRRATFSHTGQSLPLSVRAYDPVNVPDIQAQAVFMESTISIPMSTYTTRGSRLVTRQEKSNAASVPVRDAVVGEIIAEEKVEAMDRIRREQEEQRLKESQKPSWWNGWLWHRSRVTADPTDSNITEE